MIKSILAKLGATNVVKSIIRSVDGAKVETYNNGIVTTFVSDFEIGDNMEVTSYYNKFEVYIDDKIVFSYEYIGDGTDESSDKCFDNLYFELTKTVKELLTPIKATKKKVQKLALMTVENGCSIAEALTAKILMNKLILRSFLN